MDLPDCTDRCKSQQHGDLITTAISNTEISDKDLCSYLSHICFRCESVRDSCGRTALHIAASCGRQDLVRWLVQNRHADINVKDKESGYTALHRSILYGQINAAVELLQSGASLDQQDISGFSAFDIAMKDCRRALNIVFDQKVDGKLYSWGSNASNALGPQGSRTTAELMNAFHKENVFENVKLVDLGEFHSLILTGAGRVYTCGHGYGGRLGLGLEQAVVVPTLVDLDVKIVSASVSRDHSIFLGENSAIFTCGLNTHRVLGIAPPPAFVDIPHSVRLNTTACFLKGVCCGRFHSVAWSHTELYTWGLNGGQLGHPTYTETGENYIIKPKSVSLPRGGAIGLVAASDGATVIYFHNGDLYILYKFKIRRIAKRLNLISLSVFGGQLTTDFSKDPVKEICRELKIAAATKDGRLFYWQESYDEMRRCIFSQSLYRAVNHVSINMKEVLFATREGEAFSGIFPQKRMKTPGGPPKNKLEADVFMEVKKLPRIYNAVFITSDPKGKDYCVLQGAPFLPDLDAWLWYFTHEDDFSNDFKQLLEQADEADNLHDVTIKIRDRNFVAHRFVLCSRGVEISPVVSPEINPLDFQEFLLHVYTGNYELCQNLFGHLCKDNFQEFDRRKFPELCDVTISCRHFKEVKAHKCVLSARLEYFRNMFSASWAQTSKVNFEDFPLASVELLLDFLYANTCEFTQDLDYILQAVILADQLNVIPFLQRVEQYLIKRVNLRNLVQIFVFSLTYNLETLREACKTFIVYNSYIALDMGVLEELDQEKLKEITEWYIQKRIEFSPSVFPKNTENTQGILEISRMSFEERASGKTQKRRSRTKSTPSSKSLEETDNNIIQFPDADSPVLEKPDDIPQRLKAIILAQKQLELVEDQPRFTRLSLDDSEDFPELISSPPNSYPKNSYKRNEGKHKIVKLSQKQRKRLSSESSNNDSSISESPKNPWKVLPEAPISPLGKLSDIILQEKKEKENLVKLTTKELFYTQMEDQALLDLRKFYNCENVSDEVITLERVSIGAVASPMWVPKPK